MPTTALIYCRMSSDREGAGLGVARQEADCRQLADSLGWTVVDVLADNDISAYGTKRRPGYQELLRRLQTGEAGGVVAWHPDRLHRRPSELERFIDIIEDSAVQVETVKAGSFDLSSPSGRMIARMLGAAARFEVEHNIERIRTARQQKIEAGEWVGGRRPFGYGPDGMAVVEDEAALLRQAASQIVEGASVRSVARWMNSLSTTTAGNPWTAQQIRRTILNPRNVGMAVHNRQPVGPGKWPAILDPDLWEAARAVLLNPSRVNNLGAVRRFLGSGLFLCGVCADGTTVVTSTSSTKPSTGYACRTSKHLVRDATLTDRLVSETVLARLRRPDVAGAVAPDRRSEAGRLHVKMEGVRGRLDELSRMFAAGAIDGRQLTSGSVELRGELAGLERQLAAVSESSSLSLFAGRDPAVVWDGMDLDRRRAVVAALMTVTLEPGRKGRPKGWRPGEPYFDFSSIRIVPR